MLACLNFSLFMFSWHMVFRLSCTDIHFHFLHLTGRARAYHGPCGHLSAIVVSAEDTDIFVPTGIWQTVGGANKRGYSLSCFSWIGSSWGSHWCSSFPGTCTWHTPIAQISVCATLLEVLAVLPGSESVAHGAPVSGACLRGIHSCPMVMVIVTDGQ